MLALIIRLKYIYAMGIGLFIGNLNYETENETLKKHLEKYGEVTACEIITDKFTFRSKGFAKVETPDESEAEKIIAGAEGIILDGRPLRIERFRDS